MQNNDINCNVLFSIIREMFIKSPVAAAICDTNGNIIISNLSFQKLTEDKYSNIAEILNINSNILLSELKNNNNEYVIPRQDFSKINKNVPYVKARFYLMNLLNKDYISVVIINITNAVYLEQKLQNEKVMLQKLFNDINDVIFMTDLNGIVTYCSVSAETSLGYSLNELVGKNLIDFIHPEDLAMSKEKCKLYVQKHPIVKNKTFRLQHKNGKYIWFEFSHISFLEENNERIGTLIFLKENEEILKLQSEREKIYKELEYEKLKSEFICKVSHELRTPLNIMYGTVQLIELFRNKENDFIENFDKFFPILKKNMYRLLRLVNNIIDLTSIDAKNMGLHLQNINIISLIEDICNSVNQYLENKNVKIIYNPHIEEKIITCDVEKIERAILNLLSNAVKFSNDGSTILVEVYEENSFVIIRIKDNGIGIPENLQDIIFDRFRQVDCSFTRKKEGSGIGLSIAKEFIKMHNGEILVESKDGEGSEFLIKLPEYQLNEEIAVTKLADRNYLENVKIEFSDIQ